LSLHHPHRRDVNRVGEGATECGAGQDGDAGGLCRAWSRTICQSP
jgi:hypothetical protein